MLSRVLSRASALQPRGAAALQPRGAAALGSQAPYQWSVQDAGLVKSQAYVGGQWVGASSTFPVVDPATLEHLGDVADMGASETAAAVQAAHDSWAAWRALTGKARGQHLRALYDLMVAHQEDLAQIITAEAGKPLAEARGEVLYAASYIEYYAEEAKRGGGEVIPAPMPGRRLVAVHEPVGVAALITPWNFPTAMLARKMGPALAAGCPVVCKPSEETPYSALALAELADRAGFPAGTVNVVPGSRDNAGTIGGALTLSPLVRKVSFTGSTAVGKILMAQAASSVKKVSLELGGNSPFIVFEDADLDAAVAGAMAAKYRNSGQTCVSLNRLFVHETVHDEFVAKLTAKVEELRVGHGAAEGVSQGPLINQGGFEKVAALVDDAVAKGAQTATGGAAPAGALGPNFFAPTVLTGVSDDMRISQEEIFGPVVAVRSFGSEEEVVAMANDCSSGLAAYFYARDVGRVWRVAGALEYGMVGVNEGVISTEVAPFGGIKESGLGREGATEGMREYQETKYVCMGGL